MNRDYRIHPAQTHLELFIQMAQSDAYGPEDIEQCNRAYHLALPCVYALVRGSGKPFISHLVGTASILASQNARVQLIVAGLLHAIYQRRVDFPGAADMDARRNRVEADFGADIEELVYDYTLYEEVPLAEYCNDRNGEHGFLDILAMRLADELEDLSCFALFMHGRPGDSAEVKGSYLWRRNQKREHVKAILSVIETHGAGDLREAFLHWIDAEPGNCWPESLKSGRYSSYTLD